MNYNEFYRRSIEAPEAFWAEQAKAIHWHTPPRQILDDSNPPFRRWFVGGQTNLCYNAVDRHLDARADQLALVGYSTETDSIRELSYRELYLEVNTCAAVLVSLGVSKGERVVIYMPHTLDAVIAMLACARIGAIHSVVFGGFAALNLALRIDDAKPKLLICADAGSRGGKVTAFKPLVDEALARAEYPPGHVLIINRGLAPVEFKPGRDLEYAPLRDEYLGTETPVTWLESNEPSYLLYTSGTTGKPKGVQRDVGGYAVALAMSMWAVYDLRPGQVMFCTSDIGWVVGHSYNVYGPLIAGATSILHEGLPITPDPGIWWRICERYGARTMFSSPTAIRVLKKQDPAWLKQYDLSQLKYLFLAGEPLDEPTAQWISQGLGNTTIIDNYWQTETGWPVLALMPGVELKPVKFGSPGLPTPGYRVRVIDENIGQDAAPNQKGVLVIQPPLPPGCLTTIWGDDQRFVSSYFSHFKELLYSSLDWAIRDEEGYTFILGRTDDVINVAGHRLGTREIEESVSSHPGVAEAAVIGVHDEIKGQVPVVFATLKQAVSGDDIEQTAKALQQTVASQLGAVARPARVYLVGALPKTRSGKLLRRSLQALAEHRDPGDLSTLDDPNALEEVRRALARD